MLTNQSKLFSLPKDHIYLNCAYMSPLLKRVEEAGIMGIKGKSNPTSISPSDFFKNTEILREEFGKLISTEDHNRIVIIPSASYGISTVAKNVDVSKGQNIIVMEEQFPSNYYPWKSLVDKNGAELRTVKAPKLTEGRGKAWNEKILESIDENTKLVAMTHVHWADGTLYDLKAIRKKTQEVGALLIIDGTQSVGALPFNINDIQPDALICAGYKWLLGPYSIGLAYYGKAFDNGEPLEENWINRAKSEDFSGLVNYQDSYQPGSLRYEVGEHSNFILVPMMLEAVRQINTWGPENIQTYCHNITKDALNRLKGTPYIFENDQYRAQHLFGIRATKGLDTARLKELMARDNIHVSVRGDAVRISPHLYNNADQISLLVDRILEL
ncbi:aminotransferase class V-fold PLP-dependent enzyme [Fulvivirga sp. 29W222]|uniref:Aminotransferase class V-fold PLP-dependent enzyme n=1 Tax=Fulvivirga marina TaxID=2494733 RepID=A0A937KEQ5_9BACT|nr:aminotransferase class V-fold PLP-dependent enzyme [Fulvivirga marina]MBL6447408.1 aminotransferase class V-fold PLP-dependent enzyme [Fulvivirga marina]